jgi:hypothetical protein
MVKEQGLMIFSHHSGDLWDMRVPQVGPRPDPPNPSLYVCHRQRGGVAVPPRHDDCVELSALPSGVITLTETVMPSVIHCTLLHTRLGEARLGVGHRLFV